MQIEERVICRVSKANGRGGGGGGRITKIERDLHNSSNHAKAKSNYGFIIHSQFLV